MNESLAHVPPHDADAEHAILGSMLLDNALIAPVMMALSAEDFYLPECAVTFSAIKALFEDGQAVDHLTVRDKLMRTNSWDRVGSQRLMTFSETVPSLGSANFYAAIVRRKATTRKIIELGAKAVREGHDEAEIDEVVGKLQADLMKLTSGAEKAVPPVHDLLTAVAKKIESGSKADCIPTGIPFLDKILGGGCGKGQLTVIGARPGHGKSSLADCIALYAGKRGARVGEFATEVSRERLVKNLLIIESQIPEDDMNPKDMTDSKWRELFKAQAAIDRMDLLIDHEQPVSLGRVYSATALWHAQKPVDLIIVDYLQDMKMPKAENNNLALQEIVSGLKSLAIRLNVAMVLLSQFNREIEHRIDREPKVSDLRGSGSIEQTADKILLLTWPWKDNDTLPHDDAFIYVAKNKHGRTGRVKMLFRDRTTTWQEKAREPEAGYEAGRGA